MEKERELPPRKKVGPFNIDTMPPGTRRRAEAENRGIRSRNVARAMSSSVDIPRRNTGDRPVVTKKNRGQQPTRRKARSLPRNVAKEMDPKGPPKGTKSSLERSKPTADPMKVTSGATKPTPPKMEVKPNVVPRLYATPKSNKKLVDKENAQKKAAAKGTKKTSAKSKSSVVTPKMIKDAGFTNLRDYLNAKQGKTRVKGAPTVTGEGKRNVGIDYKGAKKKANVTREQLVAAGLTTGPKGLNTYLNKFDELGRRPKPSDFKKPAEKKNKPTSPASARGRGIVKKAGGGMMKSKMSTKGGMAGGKKRPPGMMGGGMKSKMSTKGGAMGGKKRPPGMAVGGLKSAPEGNKGKGLRKLPKEVRNKMGFMQAGGMKKPKGYANGGKKSKGYAAGGIKSKMATKKKATKQKVRGAGIARKGVRPAKMR